MACRRLYGRTGRLGLKDQSVWINTIVFFKVVTMNKEQLHTSNNLGKLVVGDEPLRPLVTKPHSRRYWICCLAIIFIVGFVVYCYFYGMRPDPRFTYDNLKGMTSQQVISEFGEPDVIGGDRAYPGFYGYRTPARWPGAFAYSIWFEGGKVTHVDVGGH